MKLFFLISLTSVFGQLPNSPDFSPPSPPSCGNDFSADVLFALDQSGSVGQVAWNDMVILTKDMIDLFNTTSGAKVGLIVFNSEATLLQTFTSDLVSAKKVIHDHAYAGGGTNFNNALTLILSQFSSSSRQQVGRILFFLTDGQSQVKNSLISSLNDLSVLRYTLGFANIDHAILEQIASGSEYKYVGTDSANLRAQVESSFGTICEQVEEVAEVAGDPHLTFPNGGRADFRGENNMYWNLLSDQRISVNAKTMNASFWLKGTLIHGSFFTEMCIVAKEKEGSDQEIRLVHNATKVVPGSNNFAFDSLTGVDARGSPFTVTYHSTRTFGDMNVSMKYSSSRLHFLNWTIDTIHLPVYDRVAGPFSRLNIQITHTHSRSVPASFPHGLIGQSFDGASEPRNGALDNYPETETKPFTTKAQAEGAIEGVYTDYKTKGPFDTRFKFSKFKRAQDKTS